MRKYKFWTTSEIKAIEIGLQPQGRTLTACRRFCMRHGIKFHKKQIVYNMELLQEIERKEKIRAIESLKNEIGKIKKAND